MWNYQCIYTQSYMFSPVSVTSKTLVPTLQVVVRAGAGSVRGGKVSCTAMLLVNACAEVHLDIQASLVLSHICPLS